MSEKTKYYINSDLALELEAYASEVDTSPRSLLEGAVRQLLENRKTVVIEDGERRSFMRTPVDIPAVICVKEELGASVRYQSATIKDISPEGIRLVCSDGKLCGRFAGEYNTGFEFELIFDCSGFDSPIRFQCRAQRIELFANELHVGANLLQTTPLGQQAYQQLLEGSEARVEDSEV